MGRRQDTGENEVSLFPFLSILACIIGVLTLMISTLALSQMDTKAIADAEEFEKVVQAVSDKEAELAQIQNELNEQQKKFDQSATAKQKELTELQKRMEDQLAQFLIAQKRQKELTEEKQPESDQEIQLQPLEELKLELAARQEDVAQLVKQLEERKKPPEEAEFSVLPGGSGIGVIPRFVECTKTELVLHNPDGLIRVRAGGMESDKNFLKLLNDVAGNTEAKVIFLVRDDGVHVYWRANRFAETLEVATGKLPVLGHGRINLEHFNRN